MTDKPQALRRVRSFVERGRYVVELLKPSGKYVWCYGATLAEAEAAAKAEIARGQ